MGQVKDSLDMAEVILSLVIVGSLFLAAWQWDLASYLLDVRPTQLGIEFRALYFLTAYVLPFENIEYVEELSRGAWLRHFPVYNCKTRFFAKTFFIQKKRGIFARKILVTPQDAVTFKAVLARAGVRVISSD